MIDVKTLCTRLKTDGDRVCVLLLMLFPDESNSCETDLFTSFLFLPTSSYSFLLLPIPFYSFTNPIQS